MVERIKQICKSKKISLSQVERETGLGKNTLYRWDTNKPSMDKVQRVADYLGVSVGQLTDGECSIVEPFAECGGTPNEEPLKQVNDTFYRRQLLSSLRDTQRGLLEVTNGMSDDQIKMMINFAKMMKGEQ